MEALELKNDLHRLIVETNNIALLQKAKKLLEENDWWNEISDAEKASIKKGLEELNMGKEGLSHEEVRKKINATTTN